MMQARNLTKLPQLAQLFQDSVKTNLSPDQLLALAQHMDEYSPDAIQTMTLPSYWNREPGHEIELPGTNNQMIQAQYIYPRDADKARKFLLDLAPPPPPEPEPEEGAGGGNEAAASAGTDG
jgi:anionic cell wall polymer biosynthesis LytR-Cps2A-Psr (LCP) family protein